MEKLRRMLVASASIVALIHVLDILSTHIGLTYCNLIETNPFYGLPMIIFKLIFCSFLIGVCTKIPISLFKYFFAFNVAYIIPSIYAVANNFYLILNACVG